MEHFHYGLVVDDIERAMAEYAAALGLTWADVATRAVRVAGADGGEPVDAVLLATYSRQGPPYVELIQDVRGGVWSGASRLDHIGYWVPDLAEGLAGLEASGFTASVQAVDGDGRPTRFGYRRPPSGTGPWIELVDLAVRPQLLAWIEGGGYDVR
ncbi:VOC family protein [Streptosporangium amethystogenes subsp. fukuiense]|uniref:VOC family protein n=1 Tax=Streptosporangium amethystogenes subsp. fukuiense TaxID=698418 RepID=A0ABW2TC52_9ACTN